MEISEFVEFVREYNKKYQINDDSPYVDVLISKLTTNSNMSKQDYLDLQKEVDVFLKSDASEEDKNMVRGYTESLVMLCNAIKEGGL